MENKSLTMAKRRQLCLRLKASRSKAYTINVDKIYIYPFFIYLINYLCRGVYPLFLSTLMLKAIQRNGFKRRPVAFLNKLEKNSFFGWCSMKKVDALEQFKNCGMSYTEMMKNCQIYSVGIRSEETRLAKKCLWEFKTSWIVR